MHKLVKKDAQTDSKAHSPPAFRLWDGSAIPYSPGVFRQNQRHYRFHPRLLQAQENKCLNTLLLLHAIKSDLVVGVADFDRLDLLPREFQDFNTEEECWDAFAQWLGCWLQEHRPNRHLLVRSPSGKVKVLFVFEGIGGRR